VSRDVSPYPVPVVAVERLAEPENDDDEVTPRQCGRCRVMFEGDPTLDVRARDRWALCPSCEAILLPGRVRRGNVIALRVQATDDA
jgi:hypothetical protein